MTARLFSCFYFVQRSQTGLLEMVITNDCMHALADRSGWIDRLEDSHKQRLDEAVEGAKTALKSGEPADITQALENLSQAYSAAGASLYEGAQGQGEEASGEETDASDAGDGNGEEDVVEADYEIVDEEKKEE